MNTRQRRPGLVGRAMAFAMALAIIAPPAPIQAQGRRGEPEANPKFQQQLQGGAGEGGAPVEGASTAEAAPPRSVQGVQIGTASPPRPATPAATAPLETRVSVRVKDAPLGTFLDAIQAQARINFIVTEGLGARRVTAFLQEVTVREALQVLLEIKGLTYQQIGRSNTYVVAPRAPGAPNLITRIYTLSYIPLIPLGDMSQDQAAINPMSNAPLPTGASPAGAGGQGGQQDNAVAIVNVLRSVLSKADGKELGKVAVEPRTNSLIVTDIPEVFPHVEQILAELDRKPPQVMIEAQIVEIDSSRARELGFEWGGPNGELASFSGGKRDTTFPLNLPKNLSNTHFFDPITSAVSGIGGAGASEASQTGNLPLLGNTLQTGILDLTSLKVTLRAMVSRTEARFLGKPKILTLNNKPAIIQIASEEAVGQQISAANIGSSGGQTVTGAERIQTGLVLKVTPQVNKEGYITMLVQPSFTDVKESNISTAKAPIFDPVSRGASTLVRVRNGQTLVMGGLLRSTETKLVRKVPILGYIPIIGWFFTSISSRRNNSDLVIFLTPTIVND